MTTSDDLLQLVYAALTVVGGTPQAPIYVTDALARVYLPGDWPTQQDEYPAVKLRLTTEDRQSLARSGVPEFTTVATIQIGGEVSYPAEARNAGAAKAGAALWRLKRQIEVAIVNSYPLTRAIQQIASIRSQVGYDGSGSTHLAALQMDLALEFYEGPESFAPVVADELDEARLAATHYPPSGFAADLS
jgi:hypothetical protein